MAVLSEHIEERLCGCRVVEREVYTSEEGQHTQMHIEVCADHIEEQELYEQGFILDGRDASGSAN